MRFGEPTKINYNIPLSKLMTYSLLYGLFGINYIDLVVPGSSVPGYHLWLGIAYFTPFIPLLLLLGFDSWELVGSLGLISSLMNDIFYRPIGILMLGRPYELHEWYMFQLGFKGFTRAWDLNAGFSIFTVTSLLMGISVYLRAAIIVIMVRRWRRKLSRGKKQTQTS